MKKIGFAWNIYIVALLLRLLPVLLTRSLGIGLDDMFQYDMLARSLAAGNGFRWYTEEDLQLLEPYVDFDLSAVEYDPARGVPTSFRAPLYPAFLALVYFVSGAGAGRFFAARLAQVGLTALLAPLTYHISLRLFPDNKPASAIAAWVVTGYPLLVIYSIGLATENLFFPLLLASFFFLLKIPGSRHHTFYAILSGFFLSLTILTRSVILPFAGLAVFWTWFILKQRRDALVMALTLLLFVSPWIARNSLLHGKLTGVESSMGYNLYLGYHPQGNGSFTFGPSLDLLSILDDAERDRVGTQRAVQFIRAEPGRVLPLAFSRLGYFFGLEKRALVYFYSNNLLGYIPPLLLLVIAGIMLLPFVLVASSAALSFAVVRFHVPGSNISPKLALLVLLLVAYLLPHVFILAEDRFHLAIVPVLAVLAAQFWTGGFMALSARWRGSKAGKIALSLAVLAVLLLVLNWSMELSRDADMLAALLGPDGNRTYFPY